MRIRRIIDFQAIKTSMGDIYSTKNDEAKGRLISLGSALVAAFYNVFITGIFYTGFLSMYDISITGVGIISFIPMIASCFSIFSSAILERFKKRKWIVLGAKIYFYAMYILATTLMPQFVTDPDARLVWFVIILFLAYSVYALFSPGLTAWFYRFYPDENHRRTRYIVLNQIFSSVMSSIILLLSGMLTDAVAGSPLQDQLILGLRYFAFVLVLVDVGMQACAKEYEYPPAPKLKLVQIFTLPFQYRKFLCCMLMMFAWNFMANLYGGVWNYHLLNHLHFSYTLINFISVLYTIILLCTNTVWQRILRRFSWIKTFGIALLLFSPTQLILFIMTPETSYLYVPTLFFQHLMNVGLNISYSNIMYMNLPKENSTAHIAFNTIGCNLFAFLGVTLGTFISSISGDNTFPFLGINMYSVQFTMLLSFVFMFALALVMVFKWRIFTRDEDIAEIEEQEVIRKQMKERMRATPTRWRIRWPWKKD